MVGVLLELESLLSSGIKEGLLAPPPARERMLDDTVVIRSSEFGREGEEHCLLFPRLIQL